MNFHVIKYSEKIHIFFVDYIILLFICAYYCKIFYLITFDSKRNKNKSHVYGDQKVNNISYQISCKFS